MNNQIYRELEKNRMDKVASEAELDNAKRRFADEIVNNYSVYDIASSIYTKPQKFKKPLRMRLKQKLQRFWHKFMRVMG